MHTHTLLEFCRVLQIQADEVKRRETPERLVLSTSVSVRRLRTITVALLQDLVNTFGSAIGLTIGTEDARPLLRIQQGVPDTDIATSLGEIRALPDSLDLRVDIQIDKRHILHQTGLDLNQYNGLFYLFLDNLVKLLKAPLPDLDQTLFASAHSPTVVIVSDTEVVCRGALFTVVGAQSFRRLDDILQPCSMRLRQRVDTFRRIASDSLNWVGFRLEHLTPLHFMCECVEEHTDDLASLLANRLLQLTIVYTANRTSIEGQHMSALYASSEQSTSIALSETAPETEVQRDLVRLLTWLQATGEVDKLTMFQNVVAREIPGGDPEDNFKVFVERLPNLLRETRWNYRVYLDGKITKHFEKVQSVNSYITDVTREISQTLDSVTKGLVDTLLASVGVVILTLLASLAEDKAQGVIFRVGMWTYAVYLLLFQVLYRMGNLYHSYSLIVSESKEQLAPFKVALGEKKIGELTTSLENRKRQFRQWYFGTLGIYVLVVLVILASGNLLPSVIAELGTAVPTSAPVPESPLPTPTQP
jgi:hypothetical protein